MKIQKFIFAIVVACLVLTSCKTEAKKEIPVVAKDAKVEKLAINISGMTCEIGCAKTIQSKLSKKDGVIDAQVVFTDSIAKIKFDANKTSKTDLIAFVDGIAGGDLYKATEKAPTKICDEDCKKECCAKKDGDKKACAEDCKKECCADKKA
ncbi:MULTISPECIES: cation transporter [Tenacibaculum]|uniref:cation transporter n=1 Tax=Tenacibaculum TaxID=104267 RepID=UPI001F0ACC3C|nr:MULTISPECIES: cation transporter [Tenacibaculum]MCH3881110.1 cation transporter [Tenacibaculum aquimarinum]MCH3884025.1 cation transporter [Tenacibaculum aquimarinum]MDO6599290.1 cation transporter [Tenacibaculum sp. 1_MG-2023]